MTVGAASGGVRGRIGLVSIPLFQTYQALRTHPRLATAYPEFLVRTHMVIRASVPLMHEVLRRVSEMPEDPLSEGLHAYVAKHLPEEEGHDEWVLDDLDRLGVGREQVLARMPPSSVAAMVGAQYYWVRHHHPVAFLGYVAVLEGYPAPAEDIDEMVERSGLPRAAFSTWMKHAALDLDHRREFDELLDSLPLSEEDITCICISGTTTARFANATFGPLVDDP
ncbi:MAG: iron-containing redox enzyme family protein [Actinomycetota bacterium]|nr:iron-containing redox enzyme family protein [Actinomycetota bacterium]